MEKENNYTLLKTRSARSCVAEGFRLYTEQFRRVFRYTWPAALLFAVAAGLLNAYYVSTFPQIVAESMVRRLASGRMMTAAGIVLVGYVLCSAAYCFFCSYAFEMLRVHAGTGELPRSDKTLHWHLPMFWRVLKVFLWGLVFSSICFGTLYGIGFLVMALFSHYVAMGAFALVAVALLVLMLPLSYVFTRYLLTPRVHFASILVSSYARGLRSLGLLFTAALATVIIVAVLSLLTSLPGIVLYAANITSLTGVVNGDSAGMPAYMAWLTIFVFIFVAFIQAYISLSALFPFYFTYGSIESCEAERTAAMETDNFSSI